MDTSGHIWMSLWMTLLSCSDFTRWWLYMCTHGHTYGHIDTHMWTHRYTHEWVYGWVCSHGRGDEHIYAHIWTCMNTYRNICRHMNESTDDLAVKLLNVNMHTYEDIWTHMYAYDWVYGWVCCHDQILQDDEYTCASAESLVFWGYLVPGPLSKSLVQTLNHIVWIKWRWGNWGN